jgi:hypothetical protein
MVIAALEANALEPADLAAGLLDRPPIRDHRFGQRMPYPFGHSMDLDELGEVA